MLRLGWYYSIMVYQGIKILAVLSSFPSVTQTLRALDCDQNDRMGNLFLSVSQLNFYLVAFVQVHDHYCFGNTKTVLEMVTKVVIFFFTGAVSLSLPAPSPPCSAQSDLHQQLSCSPLMEFAKAVAKNFSWTIFTS